MKQSSHRVKPGFRASEARDIVRMQRDARIGESHATQVLARKYRRDPAYLEARKWVWEMRIKGYPPETIAAMSTEHFGEKITWPRVEAMIESATVDTVEPEAQKLRAVENARLDWYLECLENRIRAGDDKAINTAIRISERRSRMNGIDKPQQIHAHVTGNVDPAVLELVAEARDEQRRQMANNRGIVDAEVIDDADTDDESDESDGYVDMNLPDLEDE